jgi:hypothetical protein
MEPRCGCIPGVGGRIRESLPRMGPFNPNAVFGVFGTLAASEIEVAGHR